MRSIDKPDNRRSAELLAFVLGVSLGSNKAHSLERLLHPDRFNVSTALLSEQGNSQGVNTETEPALISDDPTKQAKTPTSANTNEGHGDLELAATKLTNTLPKNNAKEAAD